MTNTQTDTPTTSNDQPHTARITLNATGSRLTLMAVRKADGTATTFATTTDLATKKTVRGMTQKHASFDAARAELGKQATQAEKLGWARKAAGRRFTSKPDAFTALATRATNKPRVRTTEDVLHNVWNAAEARQVLATLKNEGNAQYTALFGLALDGGLRRGELLGLQWRDLDGTSLRVDRQLMKGLDDSTTGSNTGPGFALPKGNRARSIDLSEETVALLREHKRQQAELKMKNRHQYRDHNLIFAQAWEHQSSRHAVLGGPLSPGTISKQFDRLATRAGVKRITVHGLRHSCATLLLSAGVAAHVVQRRLGHKSIEITLNLYAHVLPSMQADAASRLSALLHR